VHWRIESPADSRTERLPGSDQRVITQERNILLIEVLYMPGCPNHKPALARIKNVLLSEALDADLEEIPVTEDAIARRLRFPGSPTVRVNGRDVEGGGERSALACRLYPSGEGLPSEESLRRAFSAVKHE